MTASGAKHEMRRFGNARSEGEAAKGVQHTLEETSRVENRGNAKVFAFFHEDPAQELPGEQEGRFEALAESLPQLVWAADSFGRKTYVNRNYLEYLGAESIEEIDARWQEYLHPDDRAKTAAEWRDSLLSGAGYLSQYRLRRWDGTYRHFLARATAVRNADGQITQWLGTSTDVHEQKLAEDLLRRSEKLAIAGRLASSIAHEINNPLTAVKNILYLVQQDATLSDPTRKYLRLAEQELSRATHFTTQTLRFQKQSNAPEAVDLGKVMDSVFTVFAARFDANSISVMREYRTHEKLYCLADELRQAFAGMMSNALDATERGGKIRIRIRQSRDASGTQGLRVSIGDNGSGIPHEIRKKIFEAFVSTKESTGTGLGLWVADGIVRKHNGSLRLRTSTDRRRHGTVFSFFFPFAGVTE